PISVCDHSFGRLIFFHPVIPAAGSNQRCLIPGSSFNASANRAKFFSFFSASFSNAARFRFLNSGSLPIKSQLIQGSTRVPPQDELTRPIGTSRSRCSFLPK